MSDPDRVMVVDVEATCWEKRPPPGQHSEIIEIGVCVFNLKTSMPGLSVSILVKPERSKISPFCTQLTTLTQEVVDSGISFAAACARLESAFASKQHLWVSWGSYDARMFRDQCAGFGVAYPFSDQHVNLKRVFANRLNNKKQIGMAAALTMCDLSLNGIHHRGGDDAYNIARILGVLVKRFGLEVLATPLVES